MKALEVVLRCAAVDLPGDWTQLGGYVLLYEPLIPLSKIAEELRRVEPHYERRAGRFGNLKGSRPLVGTLEAIRAWLEVYDGAADLREVSP